MKGFCIRLLALLHLSVFSFAQEKGKLIPDAIVVQHAGSIGYFSGGVGYQLFRNAMGNLDLLYGYVPESKGGRLDIVTAKFAYRPFSIRINKAGVIYPANPGVFFSYTFGENLSLAFDKEQYSRGYYGWSEAFRSHLSLTNELEFNSKRLFDTKSPQAIVLYSEFNSSDLYLVSWATNQEGLSFFEIFKLGVGVKVKF